MSKKKLTIPKIKSLKKEQLGIQEKRRKLVVVTAYDYLMARLVDEFVDFVLVGDSVGMVVGGEENTLSVTMEQMIYHCRAVSKGIQSAHLVGDLPFLSYQTSEEAAIQNAGRLLAEGKVEAVKLEGGQEMACVVRKLVMAGIPVMGHIGLTPQSVHTLGGFLIQGRTKEAQERLLNDAIALEEAGIYALVLEGMPYELARIITEKVTIPTIGIGAGPFCDGQILVLSDLLGMQKGFQPKFVRRYANLDTTIEQAVAKYANDVQLGEFPTLEYSYE